jgi:hypothetical protein
MLKLVGLTLTLLLAACTPQGEVRTAGLSEEGTTGATTGSTSGGTASADVDLAWYVNLVNQKSTSFYRDAQTPTYLKGTRVDTFLQRAQAPTASYCLEVDLGESNPVGDNRWLRARAVPISVNSTVTGKKTYYLRVDFGNTSAGAACAKAKTEYTNDTNTQVVAWPAARTTLVMSQLRASASTVVTSVSFKLYLVESAQLRQIHPRDFDFTGLTISLMPTNTPGTGGSCSDSACVAQGYHCCRDGQCVRDAQVKNGVDTSAAGYLSAQQAVLQNPLAFLNYPQYYYVCGTTPSTTSGGATGGGTTDGTAAAQVRLEQQRKDYACVQHMKATSTNTPYLQSPFTPPVTDQALCNTTDTSSSIHYAGVLTRLYRDCGGCDATKYPALDDKIANCPKWHYTVVAVDSSNQPAQFACYVLPSVVAGNPAYQRAAVSARSVPHRFFRSTDGAEVAPASAASGTTQEGTTFSYLDAERLRPQNGTNNMNAVLGQMTIALDQARPAKVVSVDLDQTYHLSVLSGSHSPCPTCATDSWYTSFTAHPTTQFGRGLRAATSHSTRRDVLDGNTTLGNYEDTIFGRACWVPPTMLPYGQPLDLSSTSTQREVRLKTQAAMWVNGHQRDWYGFNKGALIGSFDGVHWFAIGKGRIVRSTSDKLFLAVNAPFGDLAANTSFDVSVQTYTTGSNGAQLDWDPALAANAANQTDAASCQQHHMCDADSDCITRLGWEYVCADVNPFRTHRPSFSPVGASEQLSLTASSAAVGIEGFLPQGRLPSGSSKRCVYRGAGALCRTDAGSIPATEMEKRKLLTCAPNFWCASASGDNSVIPGTATAVKTWNKEPARMTGKLENMPVARNHLFGRDANQAGRPLDYVHTTSGGTSLVRPSDAQISAALNTNLREIDANGFGKAGLCRPGKQLPTSANIATLWSPFAQHQGLDSVSRTDFINQISSCPANYLSVHKTVSCPVLDSDGNHVQFTEAFASQTQSSWATLAGAQNACGLENVKTGTVITGSTTADQLLALSPLLNVEARPLNSQTVVTATLARDACLRRAGGVCHTDLDCGPSSIHAAQASDYPAVALWGNVPNRSYFEEALVCGQAMPKTGDGTTAVYDPTLNRCCREVGSSLTTYSANEPASTSTDSADTVALDPLRRGQVDPTHVGRYERFDALADLGGADYPILNAFSTRGGTGILSSRTFGGSVTTNIAAANQWNTLDAANQQTCCGGGWIRKFSDGSTNWSNRFRFNPDVSNFQCLNYVTPLVAGISLTPWGLSQPQIDADYGRYCTDSTSTLGNCAQLSIEAGDVSDTSLCDSREYETPGTNPFEAAGQGQFSTLAGEVAWGSAFNIFAFFPPYSADGDLNTTADYSVAGGRRNIKIAMPSYVGPGLTAVQVQRRDGSNAFHEYTCSAAATGVTGPTDVGTCASGTGCCYEYNSTLRELTVAIQQSVPYIDAVLASSGRYGAKVTFVPPGIGVSPGPKIKPACDDLYYLRELGRMELSGIPQIGHAKIVCNNNADRLVPGLYNLLDGVANRTNFNDSTFAYRRPPSGDWHTNEHGLAQDAVFAAHDFKCCTPMGKITKTPSACCSGYAESYTDATTPPGAFICRLPAGTDVSVYFNRFVSNEAMQPHLGGQALEAEHFDDYTGEPLINTEVSTKVIALAKKYCAGGRFRRGGAFGEFRPEPISSGTTNQKVYSIVDSTADAGTLSTGGVSYPVGYAAFASGFRWNHHIYCGDP